MTKAELEAFKKTLYGDLRLSDGIDLAWSVYTNSRLTKTHREVAQQFLIYAFDLKSLKDLNNQLLTLMTQRNTHLGVNFEYIPGLAPAHLDLEPRELSPKKIETTVAPNAKLQHLLDIKEMLDVNETDKKEDNLYNRKRFFSQDRAKHRVHLYQGRFHQQGVLFDTSRFIAHGKLGYAAYTLNANGELSVFNHYGVNHEPVHSTMNAGSPVVSAGELRITNGELIVINTHSGHYEPSLFNAYRALEYFSSKGLNITKTDIYLFQEPRSNGLAIDSLTITLNRTTFYKVSAPALYKDVKQKLSEALESIEKDTQTYQSNSLMNMLYAFKDFILRSNLTQSRKAIAQEVHTTTQAVVEVLSRTGEKVAHLDALNGLTLKLEGLKDKNDQLSIQHGKKPGTGRLGEHLGLFLQKTIDLRKLGDLEDTEKTSYKAIY